MATGIFYEVVSQALRVLFLVGAPVIIILSLAGTLIAALQSATTIQEPALGYAVRMIALVALLYFFFPAASQSVLDLARLAFS